MISYVLLYYCYYRKHAEGTKFDCKGACSNAVIRRYKVLAVCTNVKIWSELHCGPEVLRVVFVRAQVAFLLQERSPPSQMTMILVNMCQQLPLSAAVAVSPLDATWKCWNRLQALSADTV